MSAKCELDRLRLKDGDAIVVRQKEPVPLQVLQAFIEDLAATKTALDHEVFILPYGIYMEVLDEVDMNRCGWYRKEQL